MERADKIFVILSAIGLVAVLVMQHQPRRAGDARVNVSSAPVSADTGPAYLLSALPSRRVSDDYADPSSYRGPEWS